MSQITFVKHIPQVRINFRKGEIRLSFLRRNFCTVRCPLGHHGKFRKTRYCAPLRLNKGLPKDPSRSV